MFNHLSGLVANVLVVCYHLAPSVNRSGKSHYKQALTINWFFERLTLNGNNDHYAGRNPYKPVLTLNGNDLLLWLLPLNRSDLPVSFTSTGQLVALVDRWLLNPVISADSLARLVGYPGKSPLNRLSPVELIANKRENHLLLVVIFPDDQGQATDGQ